MGLKTLLRFKDYYEKNGDTKQLEKVLENLKRYDVQEVQEEPTEEEKPIKKNKKN